jgi:hypothetical protein
MNHSKGDRIPAELADVGERLRAQRVEATALELDELKLRARRQAAPAAPQPFTKGSFVGSRVFLTLLVVLGMMMSTTGATLAITGGSGSENAGVAQYGDDDDDDDGGGDLGGQQQGPGGGGDQGAGDEGGEPGAEGPTEAGAQPAEQVSAQSGDGSLPFTGFLAIPLLIGGVALVGTGAVLRRRARD